MTSFREVVLGPVVTVTPSRAEDKASARSGDATRAIRAARTIDAQAALVDADGINQPEVRFGRST
jgi:hypothetical protein